MCECARVGRAGGRGVGGDGRLGVDGRCSGILC